MSGSTINQGQIDVYYEKKKDEVRKWLIAYTTDLKRLRENQRDRLMAYAKAFSFATAEDFNTYAQQLTTISKKDKTKLDRYIQNIDWLPEDTTAGFLDGQLVVKMMPNTQAEEMIREAFGSEEGESDSEK